MAELDEYEFDRFDHHESRRLEELDDSYEHMVSFLLLLDRLNVLTHEK
jgi:hypothetical protein